MEIVLKNLALTGEKKKTGKRLPVFYVFYDHSACPDKPANARFKTPRMISASS